MAGKCRKEQGPRGDIPWKSTSGVRIIPSIGQGNFGNVWNRSMVAGVEPAQHLLCTYD